MAKNIFVFCAHSDDQILGPGATIAKYSKQGANIYTFIFSHGENALMWLKKKAAIETRVKEAKAADKVIRGKGIKFFGLKENKIYEEFYEKKLDKRLVNLIKKKKPSKIFTHSPDDPHPDHRDVQKITLELVKKARLNSEVYAFEVWNPFTIRNRDTPKLYVDISDTFKKKIEALRCFPSQWMSLGTLIAFVFAKAFIHGFAIGKRYAEMFYRLR